MPPTATRDQRRASKPAPLPRRQPPPVPPGWMIKGVRVLSEELVYCLPNAPIRGYSKLLLADGTTTFRCKDCVPDVVGSRGDLMAHRNAEHGGRIGKNRGVITKAKAQLVLEELLGAPHDIELPPEQRPLPDVIDPLALTTMTLAEVMAIAPSIKAIGDLMGELEDARDAALKELQERRAHDKTNAHKIDSYDAQRSEILDLKLRLRKEQHKIDGYDELRSEVLALRDWKKKMINKLRPLGFVLSEEDDSNGN